MVAHSAVITGIGIVTAMGVGVEANWQALTDGSAPVVDADRFAPYPVHPAPEIDWSEQIPKRGDQRQMEAWQRLGTYAAGLALDDAGIKGDEALTGTMDMIVAAAGGERDVAVDAMILAEAAAGRNDIGVLINEKLTTELRPTLFLAQLSNLLAGNISIVHKVTGSSRTFMGEEGAAMSAVQTAVARIRAGQSTHALVGAAFNAEHPDMLLGYEMNRHLARGPWKPVAERASGEGGGLVAGSGGVFLVIEEARHAAARGAAVHAAIGPVTVDAGDADGTPSRLERLANETGLDDADMIVSANSGALARSAAEAALAAARWPERPVRAIANKTGHLREAQFPLAIAVAALSIAKGRPVAPLEAAEASAGGPPGTIGVVALGHQVAEAMVRISTPEQAR
ncbi:MAG: beta-ketoacyl-ACP synthase [Hyphomicrobiales bacterium]